MGRLRLGAARIALAPAVRGAASPPAADASVVRSLDAELGSPDIAVAVRIIAISQDVAGFDQRRARVRTNSQIIRGAEHVGEPGQIGAILGALMDRRLDRLVPRS